MDDKPTLPKLKLSKETLRQTTAGSWHRTTARCHQTYRSAENSCCPPFGETDGVNFCCI